MRDRLTVLTLEQSDTWDKIVKSFQNYDVHYLSGYVKAFELHGDGEPLLFYYSDTNTRAINVVMKRDIGQDEHYKGKLPSNTYFDLITPYGYGGFLYEGKFSTYVYDIYEEFCKENDFVCEFVRFNLFSGYPNYYKGEVECRTHNIVRDLQVPLDEMFMNFEHKVRKNIKKAQRNNLKIIIEQNTEHMDDFLGIYYSTMDRTEAQDNFYFSREFFETLNQMRENTVFFYVQHEEKIISAELVIYGKENAYSYLGGTDSAYFELRPNDFLKFEAIKWLKGKGLKNFVLGGGYGKDDGIFRYKKSFSPDGVVDFYIGRNIFDENRYKELVSMRTDEGFDKENSFFPLYRG